MNDEFSQQFYYNDVRFAFLSKVVNWFGIWKTLPGEDGKLNPQTFTSLKHSCLALPKLVNLLTKKCGFNYFLTYFMQTDPLERHFGLYRMISGANYHISYCQVLESEHRLKVSTILKLFSNQESSPTLAEFIKSFSGPTDEFTTDTSLDLDLSSFHYSRIYLIYL